MNFQSLYGLYADPRVPRCSMATEMQYGDSSGLKTLSTPLALES